MGQDMGSKKELNTSRVSSTPKIDGILDDEAWQNVDSETNFIELNPGDGTPEPATHKTEVKLIYDDEAIYIAAYMYDSDASSILKQFSQRDNFDSQADFFLVSFNPFNDGINETKFGVTAAGTLADTKSVNGDDDFTWSAVFVAKVSNDDKGWYAEFKIPYSALRFAKKDEQILGLQFYREIKALNKTFTWNYVN
ncbi:MAG: carbohydrate binding family 9 domain-containing protein [Flavobacteriaceae bacterium]|nr:carbohydrate binding family 9 domain-containing protein [Flavobacteriaceae bacterium]